MKSEFPQNPLKNDYHAAYTNVLYTASWFNLQATKSLKPFQISPQQFQVLRILHQVESNAVTVKTLSEKMIDKMSNTSRLVEKLKQKGLVEREASNEDRRRVNVSLTPSGLELIERAAKIVEKKVEELMYRISQEDVILLNQILNRLHG